MGAASLLDLVGHPPIQPMVIGPDLGLDHSRRRTARPDPEQRTHQGQAQPQQDQEQDQAGPRFPPVLPDSTRHLVRTGGGQIQSALRAKSRP